MSYFEIFRMIGLTLAAITKISNTVRERATSSITLEAHINFS